MSNPRFKARAEAAKRGWTLALNFWEPNSHYYRKARRLFGNDRRWVDLPLNDPPTYAAVDWISAVPLRK